MQPESDATVQADGARDRSSERLNFFLGTSLRIDQHEALTARVRNLSAGGMMVELPDAPEFTVAAGDRVIADLRNIGRVKGEVAWLKGRRLGIRFDKDIDAEAALKPVTNNEKKTGTGFISPIVIPDRRLKY